MKSIFIGIISFIFVSGAFASNSFKVTLGKKLELDHKPVNSFREARTFVFGHLYLEEDNEQFFIKDLYCNKVISGDDVGPMSVPTASKINTEHVWPRSKFSSDYPLTVQKVDLFNLIPVNPEANAIRGKLPFGYGIAYLSKECGVKVGHNTFEPADEVKGNIARIMFYFSTRYQLEIDDNEEEVLRRWNEEDPVDSVEMEMNNRIHEIQGNRNPFVDFPSFVDRISDF